MNDFDRQQRRGLHTRREDEMVAWDSVAGHHKGLSHAHRSFTKRFSKINTDEIFELHRNGILHGMLSNFDSVVVATKAWNRLFALADWATSQLKAQQPPEPEPTLRESLRKYADVQRRHAELDKWQPRLLTPSDADFEQDEVYLATVAYLTAWRQKNYGKMAQLIPDRLSKGTVQAMAGQVREECSLWELRDFEIVRVDHTAAAACEVDTVLTFAKEARPARLRWIRERDGEPALASEPGEWRLYLWGPMALMNRARTASQ